MREIAALIRSAWLSASSYRVGMIVSLLTFAIGFIPVFFVANALQPLVAESISAESDRYFSFLIIGLGVLGVISASMSALPSAISGSISSGTFEAMLATPVPVPRLVVGMSAYPLLWSGFRVLLLLAGAALIGVPVHWANTPAVLIVMLLLVAAYFTVALVAASLILVFRTAGPLVTGVLTLSALLGGAYYSTQVIPSWLQNLSAFIPLTYGLRAMRKLLLTDATVAQVWSDMVILFSMTGIMIIIGSWSLSMALRYSRRAGTLGQY